jgi:hypothetical protein
MDFREIRHHIVDWAQVAQDTVSGRCFFLKLPLRLPKDVTFDHSTFYTQILS